MRKTKGVMNVICKEDQIQIISSFEKLIQNYDYSFFLIDIQIINHPLAINGKLIFISKKDYILPFLFRL